MRKMGLKGNASKPFSDGRAPPWRLAHELGSSYEQVRPTYTPQGRGLLSDPSSGMLWIASCSRCHLMPQHLPEIPATSRIRLRRVLHT